MKRLLLSFILLSMVKIAGAQGLTDRLVVFDMEAMTLSKAIDEFSEQTGISIFYANDIMPDITLPARRYRKRPVRVILEDLLSHTSLTYTVVNNGIVLRRKPRKPAKKRKYTISGFIRDHHSGERIFGANIYNPATGKGTYSNEYGFFSFTTEEGKKRLSVTYLGYQPFVDTIDLREDIRLFVDLRPSITLKEVVVTASNPFSAISLNTYNIDNLGALKGGIGPDGEEDIVRKAQFMPGITTGTDGFGGISVRGGNVDQNLFLLDGVPIYSPLHAVGIFSVFNSGAVKSVKLMKGVFPARYGGRLSSVWDVRVKEGNLHHFSGELDMGILSGKAVLEGPVVKGKGSFFLSVRRSFLDFYTRPFSRKRKKKKKKGGETAFLFGDLNGKLNYVFSEKNRLYFSIYSGFDDYKDLTTINRTFGDTSLYLQTDDKYNWGNNVADLRWNHLFSKKLFSNTIFTYSHFFFDTNEETDLRITSTIPPASNDFYLITYHSNIKDLSVKSDFEYFYSPVHTFRFGVAGTKHKFQPGILSVDQKTELDSIDLDTIFTKNAFYSNDIEGYFEDEFNKGGWRGNFGLRFSYFYTDEHIDFTVLPRFSLSRRIGDFASLHFSYGKTTQNLHLLTVSGIGLPSDLWVPATRKVPRQRNTQYVLGMKFKPVKKLTFTVEGFYKKMDNLISFQEGEIGNLDESNWQNSIVFGTGKAKGIEVFALYKRPKVEAWLSYTLSKSTRTFPKLNLGKPFPYRFDRTHVISAAWNYQLNKKWRLSAAWTYSTGTAYTLSTANYEFNQLLFNFGGIPILYQGKAIVYPGRNDHRMPDYHRLDLGVQYTISGKTWQHRFKFGIYNLYYHKNPVYYRLGADEFGNRQYYQLILLPIFPALRYAVKF